MGVIVGRAKKHSAGYKVSVVGNKCYRCGHAWIPRDIANKPSVCPKCKSPYWHKPKKAKGNE